MSDCCDDCKCGTESFGIELVNYGYNSAAFTPVSTNPNDVVRGPIDGEFNANHYSGQSIASHYPIWCFVHADWCCHRPTKALIAPYAVQDVNGAVRAIVESNAGRTKYVFVELDIRSYAEFPEFHDPNYAASVRDVPLFGGAGSSFAFTPKNAQDSDSYITAPWPLGGPRRYFQGFFIANNRYVGSRGVVRCGYRSDGEDTIVKEFLWPYDIGMYGKVAFNNGINRRAYGTLSVACHWEDIVEERDDQQVRCGIEVSGLSPGFTYPFLVPRSLFVVEQSVADPKPHDAQRYVGAIATYDEKQLYSHATTNAGNHTDDRKAGAIIVERFAQYVTCAADYAFVMPDPISDAIVPPVAHADPTALGGPVTAQDPFFVRRPDIIARVPNTVPYGDSWHASALVPEGFSLATRGALHQLELDFLPTRPGEVRYDNYPARFTEDGVPRFSQVWLGSSKGYGPQATATQPVSVHFPEIGDDEPRIDELNETELFQNSYVTPNNWNALQGVRVLTPKPPQGTAGWNPVALLMPNCYHARYSSGESREFPIATPNLPNPPGPNPVPNIDAIDTSPGGWHGDPVGPFSDAQWQAHIDANVPVDRRDYRAKWKYTTYPQIWAVIEPLRGGHGHGPLDVPLEDSGMTTADYDNYSRRAQGTQPTWASEFDNGVRIDVYVRLGKKIELQQVKGFLAKREKTGNPITVGTGGGLAGGGGTAGTQAWMYQRTGEIETVGDVECSDVACFESYFSFSLWLTRAQARTAAAGQWATIQIPMARQAVLSSDDETLGDTVEEGLLIRTVKVRAAAFIGS